MSGSNFMVDVQNENKRIRWKVSKRVNRSANSKKIFNPNRNSTIIKFTIIKISYVIMECTQAYLQV